MKKGNNRRLIPTFGEQMSFFSNSSYLFVDTLPKKINWDI